MYKLRNKVITTKREVERFNRMWPCSTLRSTRHYWFEFDPRNGDLIDTDVPEQDDGDAAAAMADDCKKYLFENEYPIWGDERIIEQRQ